MVKVRQLTRPVASSPPAPAPAPAVPPRPPTKPLLPPLEQPSDDLREYTPTRPQRPDL